MEFDNDVLKSIREKKKISNKYSDWYGRLNKKYMANFSSKQTAMRDCLNYWLWDKYESNKVLDLQEVHRCKNYRFCPNCRTLHIAKQLHKFEPHFKKFINQGYLPFLMTLTIPNVPGEELSKTITKMGIIFKKFWTRFHDKITSKMAFKSRYVDFVAAVRILEITVQKTDNNMYHPHFHVLVFIKDTDYYNSKFVFEKTIPGAWSNKHNQQIYNSLLDIQIAKIWYIFFNDMCITEYDNVGNSIFDLYQCDIRECELPNGLFEVFKYTFKDTDIRSFDNFETLVLAMQNKRLTMNYGSLYKLDLENVDDKGKKQDLSEYISEVEKAQQVVTKQISILTTVYKDYTKISRFAAHKYIKEVKENEKCNT
jgi:plasmid rolling circle replication initiator protein Rep